MSETPGKNLQHLDEMTLLLYIERQLDRARGQEVSAHTQDCEACRTLLRALERESRLLTRAMLEEDEALPARLAQFQESVRRSLQWIWGLVFGLAATGVYTLYTGYIQPWQQQLEQAGFGGSNLLGLLIFQGAFWKGWQSMITLLELLALVTLAGLGAAFFRRRIRRGSALAVVFTGFCTVLALPAPALATEFRKGESIEVAKGETVRGDLFVAGGRAQIDGTVDGDLYFFGQNLKVSGHVTGDVISFAQSARITGDVDGNVRSASVGDIYRKSELFLELPLEFRFLAVSHILPAAVRCEFHHGDVLSALGDGNRFTAVAPQASTRDECKVETVARHRLQLQVTEPLFLDGFQKFARDF